MPNFISSMFGSRIGQFFPFAYWAVKLREPEQWLSEVDNKQFIITDLNPFKERRLKNTFDWTLDLVTTGDVLRIEELWIFCPQTPWAKQGSSAVLRFSKDDAGTAFMFNITKISPDGRKDHKVIGKVIDRVTTECVVHVWDCELGQLLPPYRTFVNNFASWRPGGIASPGTLQQEVIGLRL